MTVMITRVSNKYIATKTKFKKNEEKKDTLKCSLKIYFLCENVTNGGS